MRRALALFLFTTTLAACNRPAQAPDVDVLATSVAATLTAEPLPLQPTTTPSVTGLPTTTLIPSGTPEATEVPTATGTAAATVPPLDAADPRFGLDLANPDIQDDFSQRFTWFEFDDPETATIVWEDDRLRATDNLTDAFLWWSTTALFAGDSYVQVTAEIGECSGNDAYGLAARVGGANYDQGYTLEVACDGTYRMRRFISEQAPALLVNWTASELINSGSNATNVIGLVASGSELYPVFNGEPAVSTPIQDSAYDSGFFSLFPSAGQTDGLTVYFDDFQLWNLPP